MASNKVISVVLLDVGSSVSSLYDNETFFNKSKWCLLRIIQRKIFSEENDELGIILFGSEETENNLSLTDSMYKNISVYTGMEKPNWDTYEKVQKLNSTTISNSNWVECLVVALDYLKTQSRGKKLKSKQLVVLSNFTMELGYDEDKINFISDSINEDDIKLVVIGVDLEEECKDKVLDSQLSGSISLMFSLVDKVENGVSLSFLEAESSIIYYEKKKKCGRFSKVTLTIGSKIKIPVRWIKLNLEPTRIKWRKKPAMNVSVLEEEENEREIRYVMDTQKITKFGESELILNYADLEAMKRQTGESCCILLGCVKRERISRKMLVGKDIHLVVPEKISRAQALISAFIDALIDADKFAIVRRISVRNGKVKVGALIPVSDDIGKVLYYVQLPFAEYAMVVPDVGLPEPNNQDLLSAIDNLIEAMTISDKPKDIPMRDPSFQLRSHILQLYESGDLDKESENPPLPDFIKNLCNPYPELFEKAEPYVEILRNLLPIEIDAVQFTQEENNVTRKGAEEGGKFSKMYNIYQPQIKPEKELDWINAETQEWPEELKKEYETYMAEPSIHIKQDMLLKSKYDKNYISDRLWSQHGCKDKIEDSKGHFTLSHTISNSDIEQITAERQDTISDVGTQEMLQRCRQNLENN